jgi:hypothetical protein
VNLTDFKGQLTSQEMADVLTRFGYVTTAASVRRWWKMEREGKPLPRGLRLDLLRSYLDAELAIAAARKVG